MEISPFSKYFLEHLLCARQSLVWKPLEHCGYPMTEPEKHHFTGLVHGHQHLLTSWKERHPDTTRLLVKQLQKQSQTQV